MAENTDQPHLTRMSRVYDFIHDHLAQELSVTRLAEVAILSPWHFQRVFLAFSGESVSAFVRRLRIERAANHLMLRQDQTIESVALDCGFGSAELLARHFRQRFDLSPKQWRVATPETRYKASHRHEDSPLNPQWNQPIPGSLSPLKLERRAERKVIFTRNFQGYDLGIGESYRRLWNWAHPRGLVDEHSQRIGIGLDNPWITDPAKCRLLACYVVTQFPETAEGIGTRTIPAGLFASIEYQGAVDGLARVYHELHQSLLSQAGVEAIDDDYLEDLSGNNASNDDYRCRIVLPVRSF